MTEPSADALALADRFESNWNFTSSDLASEIEALTEQRVAAALERAARILDEWKDPTDRTGIAKRLAIEIRKSADRPAPEGAAPTKDGDTTRCSTPSQEDTQPSCGDREPGWYWVRMIPSGPWRPYEWYHSRDGEVMWVGSKLHHLHHNPVVVGPRIEPPNAASGPGSASNTESSPTPSVAAPGPTAGDVERRKYVRALAVKMRPFEERAAELLARCERGYEDDEPHRINIIATALMEQADAVRAELLAQIIPACGPQEREAWSRDAIWAADTIRNRVRALADKLTEAK